MFPVFTNTIITFIKLNQNHRTVNNIGQSHNKHTFTSEPCFNRTNQRETINTVILVISITKLIQFCRLK